MTMILRVFFWMAFIAFLICLVKEEE